MLLHGFRGGKEMKYFELVELARKHNIPETDLLLFESQVFPDDSIKWGGVSVNNSWNYGPSNVSDFINAISLPVTMDVNHSMSESKQMEVFTDRELGHTAKTNDEGKPPLSLLPPEGIRAVARVQAFGARKYNSFHNYRNGLEASRLCSCAMRHILAYMDGEDLDDESKESHIAHACCRLMFLLQNQKDGVLLDDRYKKVLDNPEKPSKD
jgi:hypothetical protein